jgi:glucose-1-phosphate thymidylyltransferase
MQAIVLAAGYATRLYPDTKNFPKALLSVGGRPMLDHLMDGILSIGEIERAIVVSNEKFYRIFAEWARERGDERVVVLNDGTTENGTRLGAIGDMLFAIERLGIDDDLLVVAGDNYLRIDLAQFYQTYLEHGRKTLLLGQRTDDIDMLRRFAVAKVDEHGKVIELSEKPEQPQSDLAIFALYLYPHEIAEWVHVYADEGNVMDAPGYLPQWLSRREDVYVHSTTDDCYDIGTHESLALVREKYGA